MLKRFALFLFVISYPMLFYGQKYSVYLADKQFELFNYSKAIEYYQYALEKDSANLHVIRRLAKACHKIGKDDRSIQYYEKLVKQETHQKKDLFDYADLLKEKGRYKQAKENYKKCLKYTPEDQELIALIKRMELLEKVCLPEFKCKVDSLPFNSSYSDFAPAFYKDNLIFSSGRKVKNFRSDKYGWTGEFFLELFTFDDEQEEKKQIRRFAKGIGSKYHEAVICFSSDHERMFFTRNNYYKGTLKRDEEGVNNLKIFIAEQKNDKWVITEEFPFNSDEYSIGHPSLSKDGKTLYFISDMPGGKGGTDLYQSKLMKGEWSQPQSLGDQINTVGNEMFPHIRGEVLFFSSNGRAGNGGLDIYMITLSDKDKEVINLGTPVNSAKDDFALVMHPTENKGYFSSNRPGGKGSDDIYSFKIASKNEVQIIIRNSKNKEKITADEFLVDGNSDQSFRCDSSLVYTKEVERNQNYQLTIKKKGFFAKDTLLVCGMYDPKLTHNYYLTPLPPKKIEKKKEPKIIIPDSLPSVYFGFNSVEVKDNSYLALKEITNLLQKDTSLRVKLNVRTDVRGSIAYNKILAKKRASSVEKALVEMGVEKERISMEVLGKIQPYKKKKGQSIKDWHQMNRRVDFEMIKK